MTLSYYFCICKRELLGTESVSYHEWQPKYNENRDSRMYYYKVVDVDLGVVWATAYDGDEYCIYDKSVCAFCTGGALKSSHRFVPFEYLNLAEREKTHLSS